MKTRLRRTPRAGGSPWQASFTRLARLYQNEIERELLMLSFEICEQGTELGNLELLELVWKRLEKLSLETPGGVTCGD